MESYEEAWKQLIRRLEGSIDGTSWSAEHGSNEATQQLKGLLRAREMMKKVGDNYEIEKTIYDLKEDAPTKTEVE